VGRPLEVSGIGPDRAESSAIEKRSIAIGAGA
jgi:hypothetical protein